MQKLIENGQTFVLFKDGEPCLNKSCTRFSKEPCVNCKRINAQGEFKQKAAFVTIATKTTNEADYKGSKAK